MSEKTTYTIDELIELSLESRGRWFRRKVNRRERRDPDGFREYLALRLMDDERTCGACREPLMAADEISEAQFTITPEELSEYLKVILEFILALQRAGSRYGGAVCRTGLSRRCLPSRSSHCW